MGIIQTVLIEVTENLLGEYKELDPVFYIFRGNISFPTENWRSLRSPLDCEN